MVDGRCTTVESWDRLDEPMTGKRLFIHEGAELYTPFLLHLGHVLVERSARLSRPGGDISGGAFAAVCLRRLTFYWQCRRCHGSESVALCMALPSHDWHKFCMLNLSMSDDTGTSNPRRMFQCPCIPKISAGSCRSPTLYRIRSSKPSFVSSLLRY